MWVHSKYALKSLLDSMKEKINEKYSVIVRLNHIFWIILLFDDYFVFTVLLFGDFYKYIGQYFIALMLGACSRRGEIQRSV